MSAILAQGCPSPACAGFTDPCCLGSTRYNLSSMWTGCDPSGSSPTLVGMVGDCNCRWSFSASGSGSGAAQYDALLFYLDFPALAANKTLRATFDFFTVAANQLIICAANQSGGCMGTCLNTSCYAGAAFQDMIVPASAERLLVYLVGSCNAPTGGDLWSITLSCP